MKIIYIEDNLFTSTTSLAHCVSRDFAMGAGIAKEFKCRFGGVDILYSQQRLVGQVATLINGDRHIFYLITKERYYHKPTYESMRKSLLYLRDLCKYLDVKEISIPRLGCGLDKLDWNDVEDIIIKVFNNIDITINVYVI